MLLNHRYGIWILILGILNIVRIVQKEEKNRQDYNFDSCGEWNNDFVALNGGSALNEADARNQANQVLDDVNRNVVMI